MWRMLKLCGRRRWDPAAVPRTARCSPRRDARCIDGLRYETTRHSARPLASQAYGSDGRGWDRTSDPPRVNSPGRGANGTPWVRNCCKTDDSVSSPWVGFPVVSRLYLPKTCQAPTRAMHGTTGPAVPPAFQPIWPMKRGKPGRSMTAWHVSRGWVAASLERVTRYARYDSEGRAARVSSVGEADGVCNLDCAYCFFLSKEILYPGSRFRMADDLLETYVRQLIEAHARVPEVQIARPGGEPTLMAGFLAPKALRRSRRRCRRRSRSRCLRSRGRAVSYGGATARSRHRVMGCAGRG